MLKLKFPDPYWEDAYLRYKTLGGVVRIFTFEKIDYNKDIFYAHKEVAAYTTHLIESEQYSLEECYVDMDRFEFMEGNEISLPEFLGPLYDLPKDNLLIKANSGNFLGKYFYYGDTLSKENQVEEHQLETNFNYHGYVAKGYASAFLDPPLPLDCSTNDAVILFHKITSTILGEKFTKSPPTVFLWDTSYSRIFDKGKVWWGSYLWTVYNKEKGFYTGIAATASD